MIREIKALAEVKKWAYTNRPVALKPGKLETHNKYTWPGLENLSFESYGPDL
ncbi:MAG: hypothetical protein PHW56_04325 [Methanosarcinaceae archaeon]|nr:hypothetical protein [Methanosarcinaceae archaeon]